MTLALELKGPKGDILSISAKHLIKHILFTSSTTSTTSSTTSITSYLTIKRTKYTQIKFNNIENIKI